MLGDETLQQIADQVDDAKRARRHPEDAAQLVRVDRREAPPQLGQLVGDALGRGQRHVAGRRQKDPGLGAHHQGFAELGFQFLDLVAHRRLGDAQAPRRGAEAAGLGDRPQGFKGLDIHSVLRRGQG